VVAAAARRWLFTLLLLLMLLFQMPQLQVSTHTRILTQPHSLLTPTRSHTFTLLLSLSFSSRSLSRSISRSLSLSHTRAHTHNFSRTPAHLCTQTPHTHSLSPLSYLLSCACTTLSISEVQMCAILHFLQPQLHTHQAHQLLAQWANVYLNQSIFI